MLNLSKHQSLLKVNLINYKYPCETGTLWHPLRNSPHQMISPSEMED